MSARACPLCDEPGATVGHLRLLDQHETDYFQCPGCALLYTEQPTWLGEAYSNAISSLDTGAIERNQVCAYLTTALALAVGLSTDARALDYGGGHGVFVRMMRDVGLDFRWYDTHAENLYAIGFEGEPAETHDLVTAFEVLEHFADVRADLERLFAGRPAHVLVGTVLHDGFRHDWWYLLPETGQHVTFYAKRTMEVIAERFGYRVLVGPDYTLFSRDELGVVRRAIAQRLVARPGLAHVAGAALGPLGRRLLPYRSRLMSDHEALRRRGS